MKKIVNIFRLSIVACVILLSSCTHYDMEKDAKELGKVKCELRKMSSDDKNYEVLENKIDSLLEIAKDRYYGNKEDEMRFKGLIMEEKHKCKRKTNRFLSH